ncbi:hypothetical protein H5V45_05820 [Nocardioides sp. KIGAM211]|uniref:Uncharacterized protein n=1 Tax=Nocardioides luti TaxID=2761101 RepID=A0A7X0V9M8_9ACTN|nr:hypothetical protein [Nocardioides luti]MBB6626834.1 hypothetical protein [Nocardioides luti]
MTTLGTTHPTLRLAVGATALAALAACSSGSNAAAPAQDPTDATSAASSSPSPSPSAATDGASPSASSATSSTSPSPSPSPSAATSEASPSASAPPAPTPTAAPAEKPRLISYAGGESPGVTVHTRAQARRLTGAPAAFKRFVGDTAEKITDSESCDAAAKGITVDAVRTDGYAVGGVNECGGYAALWAVVDGSWKEIAGTQDSWECKVLKQYTVPSDIAGDTCYDYDANEEHEYHQK